MVKVVSLSTVSVTISNPHYEQIVVGGAGGATGQLVGQVSMSRDRDAFSVEGAPDGGYFATFSKNRVGSFDIQVSQSSELIGRLERFINWCEANPNLAESTISVTDMLGNMQGYGKGVFPNRIPNNTIGERASSRTFSFVAGEVVFEGGR